MRFLVDAMLGTLARWLRVLGFDTYFARDLNDDDIVELANRESMTLISRDRALCERVPGSIHMAEVGLETQLMSIISGHRPDRTLFLSRCLECNGVLGQVEKFLVITQLPDSVRELHEEFWQCPGCKKVYWKGSHYCLTKLNARPLMAWMKAKGSKRDRSPHAVHICAFVIKAERL
jgi:uncharacterized protein with PIN domain